MKITVRCNGGFAGLSQTTTFTDDNASAERKAQVEKVLEQIKGLAQDFHAEGADFVHYDLIVEESNGATTIAFADDGSVKAKQLLELVKIIVQ